MNIGGALTCIQCNGLDGLCSDANDLGTSIDCNQSVCAKIECSKDGQTLIFRSCGQPSRLMGIEMSNVTKAEQCNTQVWISSQSHMIGPID